MRASKLLRLAAWRLSVLVQPMEPLQRARLLKSAGAVSKQVVACFVACVRPICVGLRH